MVRDIERNPTNVLLKVEDGTGAMEVRKWIESSDGETEGLDPDTGVQLRTPLTEIIWPCDWFEHLWLLENMIG